MALVIRNFRGVPNMHWKQRLGGKRGSRVEAWGGEAGLPCLGAGLPCLLHLNGAGSAAAYKPSMDDTNGHISAGAGYSRLVPGTAPFFLVPPEAQESLILQRSTVSTRLLYSRCTS